MTFGVLKTQAQWIRFGVMIGSVGLLFACTLLWRKLSEARQERMRRRATEILTKED